MTPYRQLPRNQNPLLKLLRYVRIVAYSLAVLTILFCALALNSPSFAQTSPPANSPPSVGAQPVGGQPGVATSPVSNKPNAADDSLIQIIFSGGIMGITIMVILIVLSVVSVYLVVDQALGLRRKDLIPADLTESVRTLLAQGKLKEADQLCRERPCPLSFVLLNGIAEIEFGWPAVEKALEDSTAEQAARLYRKLEYLTVIGNLAPMLGLLGTVTGMILAFREVAISAGSAGAADLASGIYSALVTTVAGLAIAIPALGAFAIFRNKIDELISELAYSAQHVFASVRRRLPGAAPRPVSPPRAPS
ncbi:MAG: MotA/TolQ/ExbB proton channel family protein [Pirellula sp.]|nr:MotA/TolQ/ExbB proton channel family protein [Pirellula sp.]